MEMIRKLPTVTSPTVPEWPTALTPSRPLTGGKQPGKVPEVPPNLVATSDDEDHNDHMNGDHGVDYGMKDHLRKDSESESEISDTVHHSRTTTSDGEADDQPKKSAGKRLFKNTESPMDRLGDKGFEESSWAGEHCSLLSSKEIRKLPRHLGEMTLSEAPVVVKIKIPSSLVSSLKAKGEERLLAIKSSPKDRGLPSAGDSVNKESPFLENNKKGAEKLGNKKPRDMSPEATRSDTSTKRRTEKKRNRIRASDDSESDAATHGDSKRALTGSKSTRSKDPRNGLLRRSQHASAPPLHSASSSGSSSSDSGNEVGHKDGESEKRSRTKERTAAASSSPSKLSHGKDQRGRQSLSAADQDMNSEGQQSSKNAMALRPSSGQSEATLEGLERRRRSISSDPYLDHKPKRRHVDVGSNRDAKEGHMKAPLLASRGSSKDRAGRRSSSVIDDSSRNRNDDHSSKGRTDKAKSADPRSRSQTPRSQSHSRSKSPGKAGSRQESRTRERREHGEAKDSKRQGHLAFSRDDTGRDRSSSSRPSKRRERSQDRNRDRERDRDRDRDRDRTGSYRDHEQSRDRERTRAKSRSHSRSRSTTHNSSSVKRDGDDKNQYSQEGRRSSSAYISGRRPSQSTGRSTTASTTSATDPSSTGNDSAVKTGMDLESSSQGTAARASIEDYHRKRLSIAGASGSGSEKVDTSKKGDASPAFSTPGKTGLTVVEAGPSTTMSKQVVNPETKIDFLQESERHLSAAVHLKRKADETMGVHKNPRLSAILYFLSATSFMTAYQYKDRHIGQVYRHRRELAEHESMITWDTMRQFTTALTNQCRSNRLHGLDGLSAMLEMLVYYKCHNYHARRLRQELKSNKEFLTIKQRSDSAALGSEETPAATIVISKDLAARLMQHTEDWTQLQRRVEECNQWLTPTIAKQSFPETFKRWCFHLLNQAAGVSGAKEGADGCDPTVAGSVAVGEMVTTQSEEGAADTTEERYGDEKPGKPMIRWPLGTYMKLQEIIVFAKEALHEYQKRNGLEFDMSTLPTPRS
ncbi:hypothetical protein BGW38_005425 [Lunasporangiospora selenospora]|uniref:Uncharacterized protein n=1 Tax=Lunasporangiospora selenospora TaxID=979761 RepID=A0A9P6G1S5_9FUNG|nr:hypothetical protein BGW38_005425 [Lunasporangiospora selenospora]